MDDDFLTEELGESRIDLKKYKTRYQNLKVLCIILGYIIVGLAGWITGLTI